MIKYFASTAAAVAFVLSSPPAMAWDGFGHMEVAAVAWDAMTPKAQARAIELIKLNPDFNEWIGQGAPGGNANKFAFMHAATWPDLIKSDSKYHNDGGHNGDEAPNTPAASQNIGYTDFTRHKYWHFIDTPFSTDGFQPRPPGTPNVQTQIAAFRQMLPATSTATDNIRSYDLVWLLHLVGDVHQPLHATSRFTNSLKGTDAGGNEVVIDCPAHVRCLSAKELHAFWDELLGPNETTPAKVVAASATLPSADPSKASIPDEKTWIQESFQIAKTDVYKSPPIVGEPTKENESTITQDYEDNARKIAQQRIALAGVRLANLLNEAFK
jgi:hypothetical protein